jgi:AAA domain-containing protein/CHC2-type zinc finger protein
MEIAEAKAALPLPVLLSRLGVSTPGQDKFNIQCPLHNEQNGESFAVQCKDGAWLWNCFGRCGRGGDEITFLEAYKNLSRDDAVKFFLEMAGNGATKVQPIPRRHRHRHVVNPGCAIRASTATATATPPRPAPFDWFSCVAAVTDKDLARLEKLRGFSSELCQWLKTNSLLGIIDGHFAFPVHDNGKVTGAHVRLKDGWRYTPTGTKTRPLVIGELNSDDTIHVFESQWDAFAFMDVSGERNGIIITRGASNGALVVDLIPPSSTVYLWAQNDEPGKKWAQSVCEHVQNCTVKIARTPEQYDDPNAWTRVGATADDLLGAMISAETAREPERLTVLTVDEILAVPRDEHSCILGDRLLAKGQSLVNAGQPGIGKTLLALQLAAASNVGRDWCGLVTHGRGLRWLVLQTENGLARVQHDLDMLKKWAGPEFDQSLLYVQVVRNDNDGFLCLDDSATVARISNTIQSVQPDVIIADPLRDFGIGNLDSDADMIATLRELCRLVRLGNPDRALVILHHALTGRAGVAKAFGLERAGFARNSKALLGWTRGQINVIPGQEDSNEILVLTCGKNSNGKEFPPVAVRRNGDGIYEVADDFDIENWRQEIVGGGKERRVFNPKIVTEIGWPQPELEKKQLAKLVVDEVGCGKSRAYSLIDEAMKGKIIKFTRLTRTYAKR